ncbi:hypothetical protein B0H10DRAFT_1963668 [Mycena sp. CBHHK59/15]|nr:hypothetical protein B0H10DRAFT_1963668 [Mycena sp. CBHHK59/15]
MTGYPGMAEKPAEEVKALRKTQMAARMKLRRRVVKERWESEPEAVIERIEARLVEIIEEKERKKTVASNVPPTPAEVQVSIDQIEGFLKIVHNMILEKTGWKGFTMLGGPTPNMGGALGVNVYACGVTPAGNDFKDSHPKWDEEVSQRFIMFLKRCFTRSDRDAMAMPEDDIPDLDLDNLFSMPDSDDKAAPPPPAQPARKTKKRNQPAKPRCGTNS